VEAEAVGIQREGFCYDFRANPWLFF